MDLSKKQKTQNPNSCCKKKSMMGYCKSIYSCTTYVRHTSRKRRTWREKFSKLLGKRYGVYFSKLSNATFAWWKKKHNLEPEWQIIELNISNFHNSKKQNKKTSLLSATNTFFQCKKKIRQIKTKTIFAPRQVITE